MLAIITRLLRRALLTSVWKSNEIYTSPRKSTLLRLIHSLEKMEQFRRIHTSCRILRFTHHLEMNPSRRTHAILRLVHHLAFTASTRAANLRVEVPGKRKGRRMELLERWAARRPKTGTGASCSGLRWI